MRAIAAAKDIESRIFLIRGLRVMMDRDLAELYEVPTKALNQAVKRNKERFPDSFMFRLTQAELGELVTNCDRFQSLKHATATPLAFTDYGVAMLSSVLRSRRAVRINIRIMQTFIRLREMSLTHDKLSREIEALARRVGDHDGQIQAILEAIRQLVEPPASPTKRIGFRRN